MVQNEHYTTFLQWYFNSARRLDMPLVSLVFVNMFLVVSDVMTTPDRCSKCLNMQVSLGVSRCICYFKLLNIAFVPFAIYLHSSRWTPYTCL